MFVKFNFEMISFNIWILYKSIEVMVDTEIPKQETKNRRYLSFFIISTCRWGFQHPSVMQLCRVLLWSVNITSLSRLNQGENKEDTFHSIEVTIL